MSQTTSRDNVRHDGKSTERERYTAESSTPHRNANTLKELYWGEGLSMAEVGDRLDCGTSTVQKWMDVHGIPTRKAPKEGVNYAAYRITDHGYATWSASNSDPGKAPDRVLVHRLLAACEYGFEAIRGKVVHHKNGIPWDNRVENFELLKQSEHARMHANERWGNDGDSA